ncbi:MAG TPA: thioesterase family protein [Longimicrobiales bacterium]|nr:thioesterase family protein [Longimicrobiales bacterium]
MTFVARSTFRVRYSEVDQMGVAYHVHYLVWCEIARTDFIRQFGASYAELEQDGLLLAVVEANVRYSASARYDDVITVEARLERVQSRSLTFGYEIFRDAPEPRIRLATAYTKLIAMTRAGVACPLPSDLVEKFRNAASTSA